MSKPYQNKDPNDLSEYQTRISKIDVVKKVKIPLPPIELQNQFAEMVKKVESLKEKQKKSTQDINQIFNALMQKSFNGEIA